MSCENQILENNFQRYSEHFYFPSDGILTQKNNWKIFLQKKLVKMAEPYLLMVYQVSDNSKKY